MNTVQIYVVLTQIKLSVNLFRYVKLRLSLSGFSRTLSNTRYAITFLSILEALRLERSLRKATRVVTLRISQQNFCRLNSHQTPNPLFNKETQIKLGLRRSLKNG